MPYASDANVSVSISHQTLTPSTGITPQVVVDSNQRVWVKMNGIQWNSDFRFRVIYLGLGLVECRSSTYVSFILVSGTTNVLS